MGQCCRLFTYGLTRKPPTAVPDATPLVPPAPLDIAVVDTTVNLGVNSLYSLMFGPDSAFMAAFWASEVRLEHWNVHVRGCKHA